MCSASFKRVIAPLLRGRQGWDAHARHFEHEGPRPPALSAFIYCRAGSALLPRWTLLVNDDSYVIVRHLLRYASRFDASQPVLLGHALDKKEGLRAQHSHFRGHVRNVTLARNALQRSHASGVPWARGGCRFRRAHDQHIVHWARRIGVRLLCTPTRSRYLLSASALPADSDARLLAHVGYCNLNAYV